VSVFKLGILIPLKSKQVSGDWSLVQACLLRVLNAINNQTANSFECVVVGHEEPEDFKINEICKNTEFVVFDEFEPPDTNKYSGAELQLKYEFDRCSKIAKGMMTLNSKGISHWFALDADDLLRSDFVATVESLKHASAIVLDKGYFYFERYNIVNTTSEFSSYCGSSCVVSSQINNVPVDLDSFAFKTTFFGSVSHVRVKEKLTSDNIDFIIPEDRLVMYVRGTGENISQYYVAGWFAKLKQYIKMRIKRIIFSKNEFRIFGFNVP